MSQKNCSSLSHNLPLIVAAGLYLLEKKNCLWVWLYFHYSALNDWIGTVRLERCNRILDLHFEDLDLNVIAEVQFPRGRAQPGSSSPSAVMIVPTYSDIWAYGRTLPFWTRKQDNPQN